MVKRKGGSSKPVPARSAGARIGWLLKHLWGDNQRQMASEIGSSQPLISLIINGKQSPGRKFLECVASHPRVNPGWLLSGKGEPLLSETETDTLPMTNVALPGEPAKNRELLLPSRYPISSKWFRPSRYWLIVAEDAPAVRSNSSKVRGGDLLMVETDPQIFRRSAWNRESFAVVRFVENQQAVFRLSRIRTERNPEQSEESLVVDTFDPQGEGQRLVPQRSAPQPPGTPPTRRRMTVLISEPDNVGRSPSPGPRPVPATSKPTPGRTIAWPDVAGVGLLLLRDFGLE